MAVCSASRSSFHLSLHRFGLIPALQASSPDLQPRSKRARAKRQVAESKPRACGWLWLKYTGARGGLISAGLLINSFWRLRRWCGDKHRAWLTSGLLRHRSLWRRGLEGTAAELLSRAHPAPLKPARRRTAGAIDSLPLSGGGRVWGFRKMERSDGFRRHLSSRPGRLLPGDGHHSSGRLLPKADRDGGPGVVIVSETMARRFWRMKTRSPNAS